MTDERPVQTQRPTTVKAVRNGPLQIKGTFELLDPDGAAYDLDGQRIVLLCRCGHSQNQPFCDSSHVRNGFTSQDRGPPVRKARQRRCRVTGATLAMLPARLLGRTLAAACGCLTKRWAVQASRTVGGVTVRAEVRSG
jgi:CDGSH-type Zn-finger protein